MLLKGIKVGAHGVMRLPVISGEAPEEARKSHFFMKARGCAPSIDPSAKHPNCIVGTKPTEQLASLNYRQSMHGDLVREKEVLDSFNYMRVDVVGEDILYI